MNIEWGVRWTQTKGQPVTDIGAHPDDVRVLVEEQEGYAEAVVRQVTEWSTYRGHNPRGGGMTEDTERLAQTPAIQEIRDYLEALEDWEAEPHVIGDIRALVDSIPECESATAEPHGEHAGSEPCQTCTGPIRETTNLACETCGADYGREAAEPVAYEVRSARTGKRLDVWEDGELTGTARDELTLIPLYRRPAKPVEVTEAVLDAAHLAFAQAPIATKNGGVRAPLRAAIEAALKEMNK